MFLIFYLTAVHKNSLLFINVWTALFSEILAIQVSLTDIQFIYRILDNRIPVSVAFLMEGFVNFINFFEKFV